MVGGRCHDAGINLGPVEMIALYVLLASRAYARRARLVLADVPGGARGQQVLRVVVGTTANNQAAIASQLGVTRTV